jgi:hypothetical protein
VHGLSIMYVTVAASYHRRPIVRPGEILGVPSIDHRLDSKSLARVHHPHRLVLRIVWDVRRCVEQTIDAVPGVCAHHRTALLRAVLRDCIADISVELLWFDELNTFEEGFVGDLHKMLRRLVDFAYKICLVEVTVVAVVVHRDVDVTDVTFFQLVGIWHTMANDLQQRTCWCQNPCQRCASVSAREHHRQEVQQCVGHASDSKSYPHEAASTRTDTVRVVAAWFSGQ